MNIIISGGALILAIVCYFMFVPPINQDLTYHNFADKRSLFGIPNFGDVMSNLIFFVVGIYGLNLIYSRQVINGIWKLRLPILYFSGVMLTCVGSAYYHYNPNNTTLVWDRLPMAIVFMTLLSAILENRVFGSISHLHKFIIQYVLIIIGLISVTVWSLYDDLRLYILVQFGSMLYVIGVILNDIRKFGFARVYSNTNPNKYLILGMGFYILAKILEYYDKQTFYLTFHILSGHTLKHLTAGIGAFYCGRYMLSSGVPQHSRFYDNEL